MYANHYVQSIRTLNQMSRNFAKMQMHMLRVATGMRINSPKDDPCGWAIGQRMDVEIRGLDQASRNAQQAKSMCKVADGALTSTLEILTTLKEKAIEAANGTATDQDRQNIQKFFDQNIRQIDDNAFVTYNGRYLFDGSNGSRSVETQQAFTNQSLSQETTNATRLTDLARRDGEALGIEDTDTVTVSYIKDGKTYSTSFSAKDKTLEDIFNEANRIEGGAGAVFDTSGMDGSANIGTTYSGKALQTASGENAVTVKAAAAGRDGALSAFTISVQDSGGNIKKSVNTALDAFSETIEGRNASGDNALQIQTGTQANAAIKIALLKMDARTLGLMSKDGSTIDVTSQKSANAAINAIDNAIARVLDQQTTVGAMSTRLDYTVANLTTQSENLTAAYTTLMSADLAREMTELAKSRVLGQAGLAMLAQSNQNASSLLSLLF